MSRKTLLSGLTLLFVAGPALSAGSYLPGTEDVPLMPGLRSLADQDVVFDKPQGRIVEASAQGAVKRAEVLAFYTSSLPSLGWERAGSQHFDREGERLSLDFTGRDGNLVVGFTLAPH